MGRAARDRREERLEGVGVHKGVSIGVASLVDDPRGRVVRMRLPEDEAEGEIERYRQAVVVAQSQILEVKQKLRAALGEEHAYILEAHLLMLQDRTLGRQIEEFIRDNHAEC